MANQSTNKQALRKADKALFAWIARNGILLMRISLGIVFFWFGFQKFFPGISSAEDIATKTIETMTFGIVGGTLAMTLLAVWETIIGIWFFWGRHMKILLVIFILQMIGTFFPLFLFPNEAFYVVPVVPTLEGQYIIKNLVLIAGALLAGAYQEGLVIKRESK